ncbi:hypothetical protein AM593_07637, partial [Mytilus galloprovincialis]
MPNSYWPKSASLRQFGKIISWWPDKHFGYVDTCANSLSNVRCSKGCIRIKKVKSYRDPGRCDKMKQDCVKDRLEDLCDGNTFCSKYTMTDSCLFQERFSIIDYICKSEQYVQALSVYFRFINHALDMTTISTSDTSTEGDQQVVLNLDENHRVEIYLNRKLYLCSLGWDNNDAGVLCKSLNKTGIGNATFVDKSLDIPTLPYSIHCGGHESSTNIPAEGVTNPSSNKLSSVKSGFPTLGVAVGVPVGIICMIFIIVAVVLIRR